jgi:hypothetical protein
MMPGNNLPNAVKPDTQELCFKRAIFSVLGIVFACPNNFYRLPRHSTGKRQGIESKIRFVFASEPTAQEGRVNSDIFERRSSNFGSKGLNYGLCLKWAPNIDTFL